MCSGLLCICRPGQSAGTAEVDPKSSRRRLNARKGSKQGRKKRKKERTSLAPFLRKERWTDIYILAPYACWTSEKKIHQRDGHGNSAERGGAIDLAGEGGGEGKFAWEELQSSSCRVKEGRPTWLQERVELKHLTLPSYPNRNASSNQLLWNSPCGA